MKIIRWIIYLPVAAVLVALAQTATGLIAEHLTWWIAAPLILFFGAVIAFASLAPCMMAPDRRTAAIILLTLFIFLESISLFSTLPQMTTFEAVVRLYTDVVIVLGAVAAYKVEPDEDTANQVAHAQDRGA